MTWVFLALPLLLVHALQTGPGVAFVRPILTNGTDRIAQRNLESHPTATLFNRNVTPTQPAMQP